MSKQPKNCPCCGSDCIQYISAVDVRYMYTHITMSKEEEEDCDGWYIICNASVVGCGTMSGWGATKKMARKIWNKRVKV